MPTAVAGPARAGATSWVRSAAGSRWPDPLRGRPRVRGASRNGRRSATGNYRQHITFAGVLGVAYAWLAYAAAGVHWVYGSVAALLTTLGGLLPDLDSASGVELRGFTGILGVLAATAVWHRLGRVDPPPVFEIHLWAVVFTYVLVRHGLRRGLTRIAVHRGISHSLPTCAVWGALAYLYYPAKGEQGEFTLRLLIGTAVMVGFFSHLLLDEICSVDLRGARVNKAFGTAIKLWAPSIWTTLIMYLILAYLSWRVIEGWPEGPFRLEPPEVPAFPYRLPDPQTVRSYVPKSLWPLLPDPSRR